MPTYNYYCSKCDFNHTDLRTFEDREDPSECPECGMTKCPLTYDNSRNKEGGSEGVLLKGLSTPKFYHKVGVGNKKYEETWLEGEIENTKDALRDTNKNASPYGARTIPYEELAKQGSLKKVDKKTSKLKKKASREVAKRASENFGEKDYEYMGKNKKK